jgi:general secretion pathway protein J
MTSAHCSHPPTKLGGFTLVEVLIALVLLGLIMTILFSGLRLASGSWDGAQRQVEQVVEAAMAVRFLRRQVGTALHVDWPGMDVAGENPLAFRGERDRLRFVGPLPAHVGDGGLHWITLQLGGTERGAGLVLASRLFHPDTLGHPDDRDPEAHLILPGVQRVGFRYFGTRRDAMEPRWEEEWNEPSLPLLVAIDLDAGIPGGGGTVAVALHQRPYSEHTSPFPEREAGRR